MWLVTWSLHAVEKAFFSKYAQWQWLEALVEGIVVLSDMKALVRMGFTVEFDRKKFAKVKVDSHEVGVEDKMASTALRFMAKLIHERATSMSWHCLSFPGLLAPLLDADESVQTKHLAILKLHWEAFEEANKHANNYLSKCVEHSPFQTPYMRFVVHFCKKGGWAMTPEIRELVSAVFCSILQTKINEDCNQRIRDKETRASSSKSMRQWTQWSVPVETQLLKDYRRVEVDNNCVVPMPAGQDHGSLFQPGGHIVETTEDTDVTLEPVLKEPTWWSPNAQSMKIGYGQQQLVLHLHEQNAWASADSAWRCELLPEGEVVMKVSTKQLFFVVAVLGGIAALAWPVKVVGRRVLWDTEIKTLTWLHCFADTEFLVQPTEHCSPMHKYVRQGMVADLGVSFAAAGMAVPLLTFAAGRGFAGLSEKTLRSLCLETGLPADELHDEDSMALELLRAREPDLSEPEALALVCSRSLYDTVIDDELEDIDPMMMMDVCLAGDVPNIKDHGAVHCAASDVSVGGGSLVTMHASDFGLGCIDSLHLFS